MTNEETFGGLLRRARERLGLTQADVAGVVGEVRYRPRGPKSKRSGGLGVTYYSDVERDKRSLPIHYWPVAATLLRLSLEDLALAEFRTRPVKLDLRELGAAGREAVASLVARHARRAASSATSGMNS